MGRLLKIGLVALGIFVFVILFAGPAWAINKCVTPDGKVTYQEEKCPLGVNEQAVKLHDNAMQADGGYGYYSGNSSGGYTGGHPSYGGPRRYGSDHVYTGPRGGRYTITESGNKRYLPRK